MDLTLILTEDCNLRCTYCYQKQFRPVDMPPEVALAAVRSALAAGHRHLSLTFFGGEPLLRADALLLVLDHARELARAAGATLTAKVSTNGLLLTGPFLARAGELGLFVSHSFDGVRPAQDAGRVRPGGASSFDAALGALDLLVAAGKPFGVYSVVTPRNVRHLAESRRFLWDRGARILVTAVDYGAPWDDGAIRTLIEQYEQIGDMYRRLLETRAAFHLEPLDSRIAQRTRRDGWQRCCPGIKQVTVGPDGTLYGCTEFFYRRLFPLGTARDWLDDEKVKAFATAHLGGRPDECQGCGLRDRCLSSSCACVNLRTTGHTDRPPASLCYTEQATLQAVDRIAARLYGERLPGFLVRQYSRGFHLLSGIEQLLRELGVSDEHDRSDRPAPHSPPPEPGLAAPAAPDPAEL
jgi:uncharacterized protein